MLYRICTEEKNLDWIGNMVSEHFDCFSIFRGRGAWKGTFENSVCIEIETLGGDTERAEKTIKYIAKLIRQYNRQEAVLVQKVFTEAELI